MGGSLRGGDVFAILRPAIDAHSLGTGVIGETLRRCGIRVEEAGPPIRRAIERLNDPGAIRDLLEWIRGRGIDSIGFSYRLDPAEGVRLFASLVAVLRDARLLGPGGAVRTLWFAGLPDACHQAKERFPFIDGVFEGDESPSESLALFGLPSTAILDSTGPELRYDEARAAFGRELVADGGYRAVGPVDRSAYRTFGLRGDTLAARVAHGRAAGLPPLMRAHVGPWSPDRREAVGLFEDWTRRLAKGGLLDVLSIGTSQLSQEAFGRDWSGRSDGGGVPINSPDEFGRIWKAARPMLVRSYSGTSAIESLAKTLEEELDAAWHALSLWWFSGLDGRGPNGVRANLEEHLRTLSYIAGTGKPFEPNVPHHFAFRGGDDVTYVVSGYLAAAAAKRAGVRELVLQTMLNTPKYAWGTKDLAKARALLALARDLEDDRFKVYLQPRGGLDYFSHDEQKAKAQLAAVTALMADIEPGDAAGPDVIHVVSFSEGYRLADPPVVEESIRIVRKALSEYRRLGGLGLLGDASIAEPVAARTEELIADARATVAAIRSVIPDPLGADGLYETLSAGFLTAPWLAELRGEFPEAVRWNTGLVDGAVRIVGADGKPIPTADRLAEVVDSYRRGKREGGRRDGRAR